jgi:hypothetical protein
MEVVSVIAIFRQLTLRASFKSFSLINLPDVHYQRNGTSRKRVRRQYSA